MSSPKPRVLIVGGNLRAIHEVLPIFEQAAKAATSLLAVADGFGAEVLSMMVVNTQRKKLPACAIALAEPSRRETRRAIAQFSGATIFGDEAGRALNNAVLGDLGTLASARADVQSTILKAPRYDGRHVQGSGSSVVASPSHDQDLDRHVFARFLKILPWNGSIEFVRHNNFAGFSFRIGALDDLSTFLSTCEDPAFEFVDAELEALRTALLSSVKRFDRLMNRETFPTDHSDFNTVPPEWEVEQPERFRQVVEEIHTSTTSICDSYDRLVKMARRKLGVVASAG